VRAQPLDPRLDPSGWRPFVLLLVETLWLAGALLAAAVIVLPR